MELCEFANVVDFLLVTLPSKMQQTSSPDDKPLYEMTRYMSLVEVESLAAVHTKICEDKCQAFTNDTSKTLQFQHNPSGSPSNKMTKKQETEFAVLSGHQAFTLTTGKHG